MTDFSCWFCESVIEKIDVKAVAIEVSNLWFATGVSPSQTFYAHSECVKTRLSLGNQFDPEDLLDPQ
ncbi:hypothetical protein NOJ28_27990 [Neorhizobium galegae]|uniref:hypothetical protein n=1 Tax=Neorhizobium galegae TaxID=399 RepID=UPI002102E628|nr:hypothetical protein [Neorhizobium galegae]MCQ1769372.1 hypothetical protein [Neorhizobium galegae]MCQ1848307.1 hypothetical protein [Neorhizobium galegae]